MERKLALQYFLQEAPIDGSLASWYLEMKWEVNMVVILLGVVTGTHPRGLCKTTISPPSHPKAALYLLVGPLKVTLTQRIPRPMVGQRFKR